MFKVNITTIVDARCLLGKILAFWWDSRIFDTFLHSGNVSLLLPSPRLLPVKCRFPRSVGTCHWLSIPAFISCFSRTKALVLELLAAVCLVRGGHEIILSAFDNFKEVCGAQRADLRGRICHYTLTVQFQRVTQPHRNASPADSAFLQTR